MNRIGFGKKNGQRPTKWIADYGVENQLTEAGDDAGTDMQSTKRKLYGQPTGACKRKAQPKMSRGGSSADGWEGTLTGKASQAIGYGKRALNRKATETTGRNDRRRKPRCSRPPSTTTRCEHRETELKTAIDDVELCRTLF